MPEEFSTSTIHASVPGAVEHEDRYERTTFWSVEYDDAGGAPEAHFCWIAPRSFKVLGARCAATESLTGNRTVQLAVGAFNATTAVASLNGSVTAIGNLTTGASTAMVVGAHVIIAAGESVELSFANLGGAALRNMGVVVWGVFQ